MKERTQNKIDTAENWSKALRFIPLKGEIILYSDIRRIKVGDGIHTINELDFWDSVSKVDLQNNTLVI